MNWKINVVGSNGTSNGPAAFIPGTLAQDEAQALRLWRLMTGHFLAAPMIRRTTNIEDEQLARLPEFQEYGKLSKKR